MTVTYLKTDDVHILAGFVSAVAVDKQTHQQLNYRAMVTDITTFATREGRDYQIDEWVEDKPINSSCISMDNGTLKLATEGLSYHLRKLGWE